MTSLAGRGPELAAAARRRTEQVVEALRTLDDDTLLAPSGLPGWSRLTIACHLRYGADAFGRMTRAAMAGVPAAYYPAGRDRHRPVTLRPEPNESPAEVVASLAERSTQLDQLWSRLLDDQWGFEVVEPPDQVDLGPLQVAGLPLLRLTEVEVHGSDLEVGIDDWGELFVDVALPFRLHWLNTRRTNHRAFDEELEGSWLLVATDRPTHLVTAKGTTAQCRPAGTETPASAVIEASSRDLLALLLGRRPQRPPRYSGDQDFGRAFKRAFPGP